MTLWSRAKGWPYWFEVINAARTGIDSHSIAAIVGNELVPMEPDLVVYYEGSNQFWPSSASPSRMPGQSASAWDCGSNASSIRVVTSFVWIVKDGLRLEPPRQLRPFDYLSHDDWPATCKTMRRLADVQNRVFGHFARRQNLPFIDLAARFPADPHLFDDAIHVRYSSSRLQLIR